MCVDGQWDTRGKQPYLQVPMDVTAVGTLLTLHQVASSSHRSFLWGLSLGTQRASAGPCDIQLEDKSLELSLFPLDHFQGFLLSSQRPSGNFPALADSSLWVPISFWAGNSLYTIMTHHRRHWGITPRSCHREGLQNLYTSSHHSWIPPRPLIIKARVGRSNIN